MIHPRYDGRPNEGWKNPGHRRFQPGLVREVAPVDDQQGRRHRDVGATKAGDMPSQPVFPPGVFRRPITHKRKSIGAQTDGKKPPKESPLENRQQPGAQADTEDQPMINSAGIGMEPATLPREHGNRAEDESCPTRGDMKIQNLIKKRHKTLNNF